ncbi:MAG TPA: putative DNA-binding domain-containing protein [Rudaea sp.]|nr:putative DNA-binding domain-containing protein [Rudaea sp.]
MSAAAPEPRAAGRSQRLQYEFCAHVRDPERRPAPAGIEDRRMGIYRDLIFCNVEQFISSNFPVIRTLYNDTEWHALVRDFLREHECHTPLFPEFAREFLRYLEFRRGEGRDDADFLLELAHYEWAELALALDENEIASVPHDPDGDPLAGVPVVSPVACVLAYRYPVHLIGPDFLPGAAPETPTVLLLVRGRDDKVRFHEINPLSAMLIERLQQNTDASGLACLEALLAERGAPADDALRDAGRHVLAELKQNEAILGTVPAER